MNNDSSGYGKGIDVYKETQRDHKIKKAFNQLENEIKFLIANAKANLPEYAAEFNELQKTFNGEVLSLKTRAIRSTPIKKAETSIFEPLVKLFENE